MWRNSNVQASNFEVVRISEAIKLLFFFWRSCRSIHPEKAGKRERSFVFAQNQVYPTTLMADSPINLKKLSFDLTWRKQWRSRHGCAKSSLKYLFSGKVKQVKYTLLEIWSNYCRSDFIKSMKIDSCSCKIKSRRLL